MYLQPLCPITRVPLVVMPTCLLVKVAIITALLRDDLHAIIPRCAIVLLRADNGVALLAVQVHCTTHETGRASSGPAAVRRVVVIGDQVVVHTAECRHAEHVAPRSCYCRLPRFGELCAVAPSAGTATRGVVLVVDVAAARVAVAAIARGGVVSRQAQLDE